MEIRLATPKDIPALMKMQLSLYRIWCTMDDMDKVDAKWFGSKEHEHYLEKALKHSRIYIMVMEKEITGYLKCSLEEREPFLERRGMIEETFVMPDQRGKGIGGKLLDKAISWFKEENMKWVSVSTHARHEEANVFWKKKGFEEFNLVYKMKLS